MSKFQSFRVKYAPLFAVLIIAAVSLAQSEASSVLLAAITAVVNRQPQGF